MAWNHKARGGPYYSRSRRVGGRVVKEYFGNGPSAHLLADLHADARRARDELRAARRDWQAAYDADARHLDHVVELARDLLAAVLVSAGYVRRRGEWRKRVVKPRVKPGQAAASQPTPPPSPEEAHPTRPVQAPPDFQAVLRHLNDRATHGGASELAELRAFLDAHPEIVAHVGSLTRQAEVPWLVRLTGEDVLRRECVLREADNLRRDLAGENPTALESLLVDQVVASHLAERAAQAQAGVAPETLKQAGFALRQAESAQRRLLAGVKSLTTLRALAPAAREPAPVLKVYTPDREVA